MLLRRYREEKVDESKGIHQPFELEGLSVDELKAYAMENQIDIGSSTSLKGILKKIKDAEVKE